MQSALNISTILKIKNLIITNYQTKKIQPKKIKQIMVTGNLKKNNGYW